MMAQKTIADIGEPVANEVVSTLGGDKSLPYKGFGGFLDSLCSLGMTEPPLDKPQFPH